MATETDTRRIALISDVHGNLPAFQAVLRAIEQEGVDAIWCLGDLVGYGAHPNQCVELAERSVDLCLIGNHDLVVIDRLDISDFSANAAAAAEWTKEELGSDARAYLEKLDTADEGQPLGLYHASPRDPVWEYVLSSIAADDCFDDMDPRVGAVGHSHVALAFWREGEQPTAGAQSEPNTRLDISDDRWLINPGSVGQPRDGDPRASWVLLELDSWHATWRRTDYPVDEAAEAIRAAGLPEQLGDRLYYGA
jgi:predicted phosphodiesterase